MGTSSPGIPSGNDQTIADGPTLILDRYRVEATLGHGAFGNVVRAYDTRIRRLVALKTLRPALAVQYPGEFTSLRERFEREAEASSRMGLHPNVVGIYDLAADADGTLILIMEYVPGGTLGPRIERGPLPLHEASRLAADAARGLDAAHRQGIVHRDIKPANLFLTAEGRAKVGDFGIAQIDDLSQRSRLAVHHPGTPLYMSPEQERETGYLRAVSDEYSLGLVLYEMLTGKRYKALEPREARALLDWHAPSAAPLVWRMTAEATGDRYPSLAAVVEAIEALERNAGHAAATILDPAPFTTPQQQESTPPITTAPTEVTPPPPPVWQPPAAGQDSAASGSAAAPGSQPSMWQPQGAQSWPTSGYASVPSAAPAPSSGPSSWPPPASAGWYPPPPPMSARAAKWALALASLPLLYVPILRSRGTIDTFSAAIIIAPYLVSLLSLLLIRAAPAPPRDQRGALITAGGAPLLFGMIVVLVAGAKPNEGLFFLAPTIIATVALFFGLTTVLPGGRRAVGWGVLIGLLSSLALAAVGFAWADALGTANPTGSALVIALQFLLIIAICMIPEILVLIVAAVQRRRQSRQATTAFAR